MPTYKPIEVESAGKEERINAEKKRLWLFYRKLTGHRKALAEKLVDRAANQLIMIEDLESYIRDNGYVEEYTNGANQSGKKQSSEMQVYIALSRQYNQTVKQLDDMLPDAPPESKKDDELAAFLLQRPVSVR